MLKILVLCNYGNSSGQLARALSHSFEDVVSEERGIQKDDISKEVNKWNIVVIAPHVKHNLSKLQTVFNNIPVIIAEPGAYYGCDTKAIRNQVENELKGKGG